MKSITNIIIGAILLVTLFSSVSALSLTSGNSIIIDYSDQFYSLNGSYSVFGNSSNLEGLNITFDGTKVNISLVLGYSPDSYNITFYGDIRQEVAPVHIDSGGSGGSTCLTSYNCSEWKSCQANNIQNRSCIKLKSYCYAPKVEINRSCVYAVSVSNITTSNDSLINNTIILPPNDGGLSLKWKIFIVCLIVLLLVIIYGLYRYFNKPVVIVPEE